MKVVALYHPQSEHGGKVEDFARDFERRGPGRTIELVSLETKAGAEMAKLYDITQYPAFVAKSDDGQMQKLWQGANLPMMNELDYYTNA